MSQRERIGFDCFFGLNEVWLSVRDLFPLVIVCVFFSDDADPSPFWRMKHRPESTSPDG